MLKKAGVKFDDGYHELALIRMPKNPADLFTIVRDVFITRNVLDNKNLVVKKGKNFNSFP